MKSRKEEVGLPFLLIIIRGFSQCAECPGGQHVGPQLTHPSCCFSAVSPSASAAALS